MKRNLSSLLTYLFILGDLLLLNLAIILSYKIRDVALIDHEVTDGIYLLAYSNLAWLFLILITNPYRGASLVKYSVVLRSHFSFIFIQLVVVASLVFFYDKKYEVEQLLFLYLFFLVSIFFWRLLFAYAMSLVIKGRQTVVNYAIVGPGELAQKIRQSFRLHPELGYRFIGSFGDVKNSGISIVQLEEIQRACLEMGVDEIFWCLPAQYDFVLKEMIEFGLNYFIAVRRVEDNRAFYQKGIQLGREERIPVGNVATIALDDVVNQIMKRAFDLVFTGMVTITILWWLFPIIGLIIKLDSSGPILYKQLRAGKGNKPFWCVKFRTMVYNEKAEFVQAKKNDSRITRVGKFLRKTSLDEFPQFINILKGEMSVVGPRPHPIKLNDDFSPKIRKLMSRHYVKPGLTGLAQSMGYRGETITLSDMKNRITLDRFYVEKWSLFFDIRIILNTVISLFAHGAKAY